MLNQALNTTDLAAEFQRNQRLQVTAFLRPEFAERLHLCLQNEVPWGLAYRDSSASVLVPAEKLAKLTESEWAGLTKTIYGRAASEFQFAYNSYMMITAYKERRDPHLALHQVVEFVNSPPFLDFIKQVTGAADVVKADAQATRYIPGHFLKKHNDFMGPQNRRIAYVINLTKAWQADWGGLLEFLDDSGKVTDVFLPVFNSISLFTVPAWHQVSYVAPFAQGARYAITGWAMAP
jgi:SM-20-related protein